MAQRRSRQVQFGSTPSPQQSLGRFRTTPYPEEAESSDEEGQQFSRRQVTINSPYRENSQSSDEEQSGSRRQQGRRQRRAGRSGSRQRQRRAGSQGSFSDAESSDADEGEQSQSGQFSRRELSRRSEFARSMPRDAQGRFLPLDFEETPPRRSGGGRSRSRSQGRGVRRPSASRYNRGKPRSSRSAKRRNDGKSPGNTPYGKGESRQGRPN
jgi:hypothetical protein